MKLGTDRSLKECKKEGYLILEYDGRKKFNRVANYRIFRYYPEYNDLYPGELCLDTEVNFDSLTEVYKRHKQVIDRFAETYAHVNFDIPDYIDLLNLADDLDAYFGIENI